MFLTTKICSIILLPCLSPGNFESTPCPTTCSKKHNKRYPHSFHILRYLLLGESWSHTSIKQWCSVSVDAVLSASRSYTCMPSTQDLYALISHALGWVCSAFARSVLYTSVIPILFVNNLLALFLTMSILLGGLIAAQFPCGLVYTFYLHAMSYVVSPFSLILFIYFSLILSIWCSIPLATSP